MKLLLGKGARVNAKNKGGSTALMAAARRTDREHAATGANRAEVDVKDNNGNTAFLVTAGSPSLDSGRRRQHE